MFEAPKKRQGFAVMSPERRREIASLGGKKAHALGKAHQFTSEEAREAGRRGGERVSRNREYMSAIGTLGGKAKGRKASTVCGSDPQIANEK